MSIIGVNGIRSLMESRLAGSNTAIYSCLSVSLVLLSGRKMRPNATEFGA